MSISLERVLQYNKVTEVEFKVFLKSIWDLDFEVQNAEVWGDTAHMYSLNGKNVGFVVTVTFDGIKHELYFLLKGVEVRERSTHNKGGVEQ